jgi:gamma-glutamylcyclotransferase (GGCT)/AIG2-like uncharacterized protein YtfP
MRAHIFTYGSLMFAPVWTCVVRGVYRSAPAEAAGFARYAIAGETYPGLIARDGASVQGMLYFAVAPDDIAALDAFEGIEYRRMPITVTLASGESAQANTYLYLLPQKLSESPWLPEAFQMERFLGTYCRDRLG